MIRIENQQTNFDLSFDEWIFGIDEFSVQYSRGGQCVMCLRPLINLHIKCHMK